MPVQATKTINIYYSGPHNKPHSLIVLISFFIPVINKDLKASHQAVSLAAVWDIKLETKTRQNFTFQNRDPDDGFNRRDDTLEFWDET